MKNKKWNKNYYHQNKKIGEIYTVAFANVFLTGLGVPKVIIHLQVWSTFSTRVGWRPRLADCLVAFWGKVEQMDSEGDSGKGDGDGNKGKGRAEMRTQQDSAKRSVW